MDNPNRKNLIYFIYFNGTLNHYHLLNLDLLRKYWHVFDGKKIIKIAVDKWVDPSQIVELLPSDCQAEIVENCRKTCESKHFIESISRKGLGLTFYAHCKGVTRPKMLGLDKWIEHLYEANLGRKLDMNGKLFSGTCVKLLACAPYVPEQFHYSGSFYWMDLDKISKEGLEPHRYLTERFPAMSAHERECQFIEPVTNKNLTFYSEKSW